jgi:glucokinase
MIENILVSRIEFKKTDYNKFRIVADVGANNTYIAIMGIKDYKSFSIIFKHTYQTSELRNIYETMNLALKKAKEDYGIETGFACIGAAGPVSRQREYIKLTNINFEIRVESIFSNTLFNKVILLNDFEAIGYGIDMLDIEKDTIKIPHVGEDMTKGSNFLNSIAVIGASKGLGMTIAPYDHKKYLHAPIPSERGHIDFVAYTKEEFKLLEYVKENIFERKNVQPEMERLVSAEGIAITYDFFVMKNKLKIFISSSTRIDKADFYIILDD